MRILLLNDNPVVRKLVALSAQKTKDDLHVVWSMDEIEHETYDLLIIDDAQYSDDAMDAINYKITYKSSLLMATRGSATPAGFDKVINKPFLPTDLVELFTSIEKSLSTTSEAMKVEERVTPMIELDTLLDNEELDELIDEGEIGSVKTNVLDHDEVQELQELLVGTDGEEISLDDFEFDEPLSMNEVHLDDLDELSEDPLDLSENIGEDEDDLLAMLNDDSPKEESLEFDSFDDAMMEDLELEDTLDQPNELIEKDDNTILESSMLDDLDDDLQSSVDDDALLDDMMMEDLDSPEESSIGSLPPYEIEDDDFSNLLSLEEESEEGVEEGSEDFTDLLSIEEESEKMEEELKSPLSDDEFDDLEQQIHDAVGELDMDDLESEFDEDDLGSLELEPLSSLGSLDGLDSLDMLDEKEIKRTLGEEVEEDEEEPEIRVGGGVHSSLDAEALNEALKLSSIEDLGNELDLSTEMDSVETKSPQEGMEALQALLKALSNDEVAKSLKGLNISININFGNDK
ncbi:MAG: hypothetical protein PHW18_01345 [Sulfuricurvum sp.]|uniref:hypothetical protein n=1 Tax=Sulfuricurvum sp. TaxID=2025608 RepID=UPI00261571F6|nr:hypothetical protein [Sulfuricurvum sp.]MDD2828199.1 hypothetical protein [Sulfuricurvum sp.]MDD4949846.1 hypothetical protein [Sulfuricurvum sp.]